MSNVIGIMTHYAVLTYPNEFPLEGPVVKYHLQKLKQRLMYRNLRIFWFMEFQRRGAVHFNLLLDKEISHKELSRMWYEIVGSNDTKHLARGAYIDPIKEPEGMLHYLTDYLTKQGQKRVPDDFQDVGRFWGYSRTAMPVIKKIIIGLPHELQALRAQPPLYWLIHWHKAQWRLWRKSAQAKGWKPPKPDKFDAQYERRARFLRGKRDFYVTIRNGRRFINELKSRGMDTSLFEKSKEEPQSGGLEPADGAPLTL